MDGRKVAPRGELRNGSLPPVSETFLVSADILNRLTERWEITHVEQSSGSYRSRFRGGQQAQYCVGYRAADAGSGSAARHHLPERASETGGRRTDRRLAQRAGISMRRFAGRRDRAAL